MTRSCRRQSEDRLVNYFTNKAEDPCFDHDQSSGLAENQCRRISRKACPGIFMGADHGHRRFYCSVVASPDGVRTYSLMIGLARTFSMEQLYTRTIEEAGQLGAAANAQI